MPLDELATVLVPGDGQPRSGDLAPDARPADRDRGGADDVEAAVPDVILPLGVEQVSEGRAEILLPYDLRLVGNPETGVLHGGAISTLMDATCGAAVFQALRKPMAIATLDLRIDYLKPATPGRGVSSNSSTISLPFAGANGILSPDPNRNICPTSPAPAAPFRAGSGR